MSQPPVIHPPRPITFPRYAGSGAPFTPRTEFNPPAPPKVPK